jgi:hypothetical protein
MTWRVKSRTGGTIFRYQPRTNEHTAQLAQGFDSGFTQQPADFCPQLNQII